MRTSLCEPAAFFTLALFSFLYKDNPFYKFAEHIFAGLSAGYYVGLIWHSVILQQMIDPMFDNGKWWLVFPGMLGVLMFSRFTKNYHWVSRLSLAFVMGNTAGIFLLSELHGKVLPQIQSTMLSLNLNQEFGALLLSIIVVVGVISTLILISVSGIVPSGCPPSPPIPRQKLETTRSRARMSARFISASI